MEQYSKNNKIEQVAEGTRVKSEKKDKSTASSVLSFLLNDEVDDIPKYFKDNVLKPSALGIVSLIIDNVTGGIKGLLGGKGYYGPNGFNYNGVSKGRVSAPVSSGNRNNESHSGRIGYMFDDVVVNTRYDAERVIKTVEEWLYDYKMIRVADLYEAAHLTPDPEMNDYGWKSIRNFEVAPYGDKWIIKTPAAELLLR